VAVTRCPKSLITAESEALVEGFLVRRRLGVGAFPPLSAREVEAALILEGGLAEERNDGERRTKDTV
jgi:hypothetical protein